MSTLLVVEEVLRERGIPMVVREIVEVAAERLPTKSKTPDTVVARDLAMDIKRRGPESKFARVSPGRYTLRDLALALGALPEPPEASTSPVDGVPPGGAQPEGAVGEVMVQHQIDGGSSRQAGEVSFGGS